MKIDFSTALEQSKKREASKSLNLLLLGPMGGGKSYAAGTLGVKTLYLYFSGESHGGSSAQIEGGENVDLYCLDRYGTEVLGPDDTLSHLLSVIKNTALIKSHGYKLVVVDSMGELETTIRNSKEWNQKTMSAKGVHDVWSETNVTFDMMRQVSDALKTLQRDLDIHTMSMCGLDIRAVGEMGEILESSPRIRGAKVAELLCATFDDVVAIGRMHKDGITKHKFQFGANHAKTVKEVSGGVKFINYNCRIKGVPTHKLPSFLDADLRELHALKIRGNSDE